jgi:hypothetical protein
MSNSIPFKELVDRDTKKCKVGKYQIQSIKDSNNAKIAVLSSAAPDICIYENKMNNLKCLLIQYSLTDEDIKKNNYSMVGYLIKQKDETIIGSLNYMFVPKDFSTIVIGEYMCGKFDIVLFNNKGKNKVISSFDTFVGNDDIIYLLTKVLNDCLIEIYKDNLFTD